MVKKRKKIKRGGENSDHSQLEEPYIYTGVWGDSHLEFQQRPCRYEETIPEPQSPSTQIRERGLTDEEKEGLRDEMDYGWDENTKRDLSEEELRYVTGHCIFQNLIHNFSFLPTRAARYVAPALKLYYTREAAIKAFTFMKPETAECIAPALNDPLSKDAAFDALYGLEQNHRGKGIGAIIRKYSEPNRDENLQLNAVIYSTIHRLYQMEKSPIKRYVDLAKACIKEEHKSKFFKGLERTIFSQ